jgi:hypothetical protein
MLPLIGLFLTGAITMKIGCCRNVTKIKEEITEPPVTKATDFLGHSSNRESPIQVADLSRPTLLQRRGYDARGGCPRVQNDRGRKRGNGGSGKR